MNFPCGIFSTFSFVGGLRKTAAQRNTNTAAAPVHSQKPKCQNTECRSAPRIGAAQDGSSSRHSLQKSPPSGTNVVRDRVQNSPRAVSRLEEAENRAVKVIP